MTFVPQGWPEIYNEAQGFNLALGLALCSMVEENGSAGGWPARAQMMIRAALADRPDMRSWDAAAIEREFSLEGLAGRMPKADPSDPTAPPAQPNAPLAQYMARIPCGRGDFPWWTLAVFPEIPREQHGFSLMRINGGDPDPKSPWHGLWGALRCFLELFETDPLAPPSAWAQTSNMFKRARALREADLLLQAASAPPARPHPKEPSRL
jgi:hypothetical protein